VGVGDQPRRGDELAIASEDEPATTGFDQFDLARIKAGDGPVRERRVPLDLGIVDTFTTSGPIGTTGGYNGTSDQSRARTNRGT